MNERPMRAAGAIVAALLVAGCGSRLDHGEFVAAHRAASAPSLPAAGGDEHAVTGQPDVSAPADGGAESTQVSGAAPEAREQSGSPGFGSVPAPAGPGSGSAPSRPAGPSPEGAPGPRSTAPVPPPGGQPAAGSPATKSPVRIGQVSTLSGPIGGTLKNALKAVQAWIAWTNARGGLNGHPIEFVFAEDGSDPSRNRALTREMVEQRGVILFLHNTAPLSGQASVSYLEEKRIPVIGSEGGSGWMNTSPMYFPQMATQHFLGYSFAGAVAEIVLPQGKSRVALVRCVESPDACNSTVNKKAFEEFGTRVVYEANVSLAQPDYTAQCLEARNAGAEVIFAGIDAPSVGRMADGCANIGYKPIFSHPSQVVQDAELANPRLEGLVVGNQTAPWFLSSMPAIAEMHAVMARYAPNVPIDAPAGYGWISSKLLEAAARNLPEPPTPQAILDGLYSVKNNDLQGLTYPITFEPGQPNNAGHVQSCWWAVVIKGGQWTAPNGATRRCRVTPK